MDKTNQNKEGYYFEKSIRNQDAVTIKIKKQILLDSKYI